MNGHDLTIIAPLLVAIGTAVAILLVDLVLPGRRDAAIGVSLVGLAAAEAVDGRPERAARPALQRVPEPVHRRFHRRLVPLGAEKGDTHDRRP